MPRAPLPTSRAPSRARRRRHRSHQRERILALLRSSGEHPTAASVHSALRRRFPRLSLGTVYRNLEILVAEGEIDVVADPQGPARYDGNRSPHHHFICERCGAIADIDLRPPPGLSGRVRRRYGVTPTRYRIDFYGLCRGCTARSIPQPRT